MSGIEVAGLVLGAFPILISALEAYQDCARLSHLWFKYEREFKRTKRRVQALEEDCCQSLLIVFAPVVDDEEGLQNLVRQPSQSTGSDIEELLKERFSGKWDTYLGIIQEMLEALDELKTLWIHTTRRNFTFGERSREKLFARLESSNEQLKRLVTGHEQLSGLQTRDALRNHTRIGLSKQQIRHIQRVHTYHVSLASMWRCSCKHSHCADLFLNPILLAEKQPQFSFHFEPTPAAGNVVQPWTTFATTICRTQQPIQQDIHTANTADHVQPTEAVAQKSLATRFGLVLKITGLQERPKKTVKNSKKTVKFSEPIRTMPPEPMPNATVRPLIADLCEAISDNPGDCLGRLADPVSSSPSGNFIELHTTSPTDGSAASETTPLSAVLKPTAIERPTRVQRLHIASQLTLSHLPSHLDSWFNGPWTKDDIVFPRRNGKLDFDEPSLRRHCESNQATSALDPSNNSHLLRSFEMLGILLLELCFGQALEDSALRKGYPSPSSSTNAFTVDLAAARLWAEEVVGEIGPEYACAVHWCLRKCALGRRDVTKEFYMEVAGPLRICYRQMIGDI